MTADRRIERVVATVDWPRAARDRLVRACAPASVTFVDRGDSARLASALADADVAVLAGDLTPSVLRAPRLRWVHCDHAGLDGHLPATVFERDLLVSSSAGRSAPALAEHALMFMLALNSDLPRQIRARRRRIWHYRGLWDLTALSGRTVLIVGVGNTGTALARRCRALEMNVVGYRRRASPADESFDRVLSNEAGHLLIDSLPGADVVVLACGLNDATHHLIGAAELDAMPAHGLLVNMARGAVIDQVALEQALRSGAIAGAGLDVTDPEPPGVFDSIWRCPNLLLTPHFSPPLPDRAERSVDIVVENVDRYRAGRPLVNELGPDDAYDVGRRSVGAFEQAVGRVWRKVAAIGL
ncbi:MAG: D-2-hydroxyacid dehydrogenase [Ilumatobacter sp.]|nr:D-2-hydroxyacid dehydrogenase [Ilumatobacter sp.]